MSSHLTIAQQSHCRITSTENRNIIRSQSHLRIKTEYEKEINSQKLVVKDFESTRKLGETLAIFIIFFNLVAE